MGQLRNLPVDSQVALLFVIVFGMLAALTVAAVGWNLRFPEAVDDVRRERIARDLRAVWIGVTLFWVAWISGAVGATLLFALVSFAALREFITLQHTRRSDHRSLLLAFFIVLPLQYGIVAAGLFDLSTVFIPVYVFFALPVVSALAGDPERFLERNAKIQWGIVVCVYGLSHAPALLLLDFPGHVGSGAFLVFFLVVAVGVADLVYEAILRRLPPPAVDDKTLTPAQAVKAAFGFSYRALLIAMVVGGLAATVFYWVTPFKAGQAFVLAVAAAACGLLGEFVMDVLKRDAGVETWGNHPRITGAVGLLDRVAPLCFAAPVFFHGVRWYFDV
jgi:phosphatidate cytidylyltransferase